MWRTGEKKKEIQRGDVDAKGLEAVEFMSSALKHEMSNRLISFLDFNVQRNWSII